MSNDHKISMAARCYRKAVLLEHAALRLPNDDPLTFQLKDAAQDLRDAAALLSQTINHKEHIDAE